MLSRAILLITTGLSFALSDDVVAEDKTRWGSLNGSFVFDGEIPETKHHSVQADKLVIGPTVPDESLIVNAENKGIANVIVYLLPNDGDELPIHPSYDRTAESKVELSMHGGKFDPHVLLLRTTQTMVQSNKDKIDYDAHIFFQKNVPR